MELFLLTEADLRLREIGLPAALRPEADLLTETTASRIALFDNVPAFAAERIERRVARAVTMD